MKALECKYPFPRKGYILISRYLTSQSFCDKEVTEHEDEMNAEERFALEGIKAAAALPPVSLASAEPSKSFGRGITKVEDLSFDALVALRRHHQTKQAKTGIRTRAKSLDPSTSLRRKIIQEFHDVMNEYKDYASAAAGQDRIARWQDKAESRTGNSANAAAAATNIASKVGLPVILPFRQTHKIFHYRQLHVASNVLPASSSPALI
jgi:hypothetical protein